ncbi:MAG: hypothetical protein NTU97_03780, partial [Candidatus Magasanikbacteria bacterium]|nr:hypothetical protein [Candidatus Magasanikbacteria bacterium]
LAIRAVQMNTKFVQTPKAVVYHQKTFWTTSSLLASAKNPAVWVVFKKLYPLHYNHFSSPLWCGFVISPLDYLFILTLPLILPILLVRYLWHGQKNIKIFFIKWPVLLFLRRYYIFRETRRQKIWIV